ncbi:hypothetical protein SH668x_001593 [Planctomicrobium sp. SH668]|uniref:hypothetical protein n=1 Tax=Planctomicrobium sp. SH668 TaxID=3448126 RepID=UPI003F5B7E75
MNEDVPNPRGRSYLVICIVVLGVIWLGVLPRLQEVPAVRSHLEKLRERNVDAGVMFYTENPPEVRPTPEKAAAFLKTRQGRTWFWDTIEEPTKEQQD